MEQLLTGQRVRAREECQRQHENLSGCIAAKLGSLPLPLNGSFAGRQDLEKAITDDCKRTQGRCLEPEAPEVKCTEVKPQETPAEADKKEEKGKGKKKDGGK